MDNETLQAIRARLDAITPGEWEICPASKLIPSQKFAAAFDRYGVDCKDLSAAIFYADGMCIKADAEFIANAPADIRTLLEAVDAEEKRYNDFEDKAVNHVLARDDKIEALTAELEAAHEKNIAQMAKVGTARGELQLAKDRIAKLEAAALDVGNLAHNLSIHARIKGDAAAFEMAGAIARKAKGE